MRRCVPLPCKCNVLSLRYTLLLADDHYARFYVVVTFLGLAISAMISTFSQPGGSTGFNTSAGVNTFSIYLMFGMTLSVVVCGRMLAACRAWIAEQRTFSSVTTAIQYV
jgi:hypothetical protein